MNFHGNPCRSCERFGYLKITCVLWYGSLQQFPATSIMFLLIRVATLDDFLYYLRESEGDIFNIIRNPE